MHVRIPYRPLKQWCIVLWSDHPFYTLLKVNTEYKHVGEQYGLRSLLWKSTVALWLRICLFCLIFWHVDDAHPACVVIINVLCARCVKVFGDGRCGLNTQGPSERKKELQ